ncbi:MAG: hypothetical protein V1934_07220 [Methanobacteriota archaeon]
MRPTRTGMVFMAITAFAVIVGVVLSPCVPFFIGAGAMMLVWAVRGGMSAGNPFKKRAIDEGKIGFTSGYFKPASQADYSFRGPKITDKDYFYIFLWGVGLLILFLALTAMSIYGWLKY